MSEKEPMGKLEKLRRAGDLLSIGLVAIGALFGIPLLVGGGALDLAFSQTIGKESLKSLEKFKEKLKKVYGTGKK